MQEMPCLEPGGGEGLEDAVCVFSDSAAEQEPERENSMTSSLLMRKRGFEGMAGGLSSQCKETHHNQENSETRSRKGELHKLRNRTKFPRCRHS